MFGGTRIARTSVCPTDFFFQMIRRVLLVFLFRSVNRAVLWFEHAWMNEQRGRCFDIATTRVCLFHSECDILDMLRRTGLGFRFSFSLLKDFPPRFLIFSVVSFSFWW